MIDFIEGELVAKSPAAAIVRVAGMGFRVQLPLSTYDALPREGRPVRLLTHLHVREDGLSLFGFATEPERVLFRMLLGVSRVGPAVAMRVLSNCSVGEFKRLILDEQADALSGLIKGIGKKTAERLVLELKGTVEELEVEAAPSAAAQAARDAVQALVALGESRGDAERAVRNAVDKLGPDADQQQLVQEALSR